MPVKYNPLAQEDLREIFTFYVKQAGDSVAENIITTIMDRIGVLQTNARLGMFYKVINGFEYRKLVIDKYICIYILDRDKIEIMAIFDARQDPDKLKF